VIYSEGIGTVQFVPVVHGQELPSLEFTNVLYVPMLSSNLFSVLYLTMHRCFSISIVRDTLHFIRDSKILFQATVTPSNSALLVGETIPVQQLASLSSSSPLPLDLALWHRRLCWNTGVRAAEPAYYTHTKQNRTMYTFHVILYRHTF